MTLDGGLRADQVFDAVLSHPAQSFALGARLAQLHPELEMVETTIGHFQPEAFARGGHCTIERRRDLHQQFLTDWDSDDGLQSRARVAWLNVTWQAASLHVVRVAWETSYGNDNHHFIVMAAQRATCEAFIEAVCTWTHEVRGEILVFSDGCFEKSTKLFNAIMAADLDQLVLAGSLKQQLRDDFTQFLSARTAYEEHGVAWKRGALFLGPPGNGKTLCVKALVKLLGIPCIYVQSFDPRYPQHSIESIYERARATAPCVIVFEDLDSLITDTTRSFFLNELDGFASNTGVITVATTNHAEKLDPAILERPSRFDRKYHFNLPDAETRAQYVALWNAKLRPALQLDERGRAQIAELTEGFSFAYVQEVFVSSMLRWMATRDASGILPIAMAQIEELRQQMTTR
jgi:hypothetical protein